CSAVILTCSVSSPAASAGRATCVPVPMLRPASVHVWVTVGRALRTLVKVFTPVVVTAPPGVMPPSSVTPLKRGGPPIQLAGTLLTHVPAGVSWTIFADHGARPGSVTRNVSCQTLGSFFRFNDTDRTGFAF